MNPFFSSKIFFTLEVNESKKFEMFCSHEKIIFKIKFFGINLIRGRGTWNFFLSIFNFVLNLFLNSNNLKFFKIPVHRPLNLFQNYKFYLDAPYSCQYEGRRLRDGDEFRTGPNGCSLCVCHETEVKCNEDECTLEDTANLPQFEGPIRGDQGRKFSRISHNFWSFFKYT